MKMTIAQKLSIFAFIILVSNLFIGYTIYVNNQELVVAEEWVKHTEEIIDKSTDLLSMIRDVETASTQFIITNDSSVLVSYSLYETLFPLLNEIRKLTGNNSGQQKRIDSIEFFMPYYLRFIVQTKITRKNDGLTASSAYYFTNPYRKYGTVIQKLISSIKEEEIQLLKKRKAATAESITSFNQFSINMFVSIAVLMILFLIGIVNYLYQNREREKRAKELIIADRELVYQMEEKEKRAEELVIANIELAYQTEEREKRAEELIIADKELIFQTKEKGKRADELVIANIELAYQTEEKEKRAEELVIADKELNFQNEEKEKRAEELVIANIELAFQNDEKEKRAEELTIAEKELDYQNDEKAKRAEELIVADIELDYQKMEKGKRAWELIIANKELAFQNKEKEKRAAELTIANKELVFQNQEKEKRANELIIANKELVFQNEEKQKRAEELTIANNELESFSYSVSHDLRAPLRAVHGFARILKEDYGIRLDTEANRVIDNVMNNASKMGKLLDDLLTFSRLGRKELVKVKVPMYEVVMNLVREVQNDSQQPLVQFMVSQLLPVDGDSMAIKQVWTNLISNAVKYSKLSEKPVIKIDSYQEKEETVFRIKDNGAGFDMRYAAKLFGVFQRLHSDSKFEGTGVGLAIVHRIVAKHGGRVWGEGEVSKGATFYFSLPNNLSV